MEENETDQNRVNFIPCLKFVKKGVAKSQPEKVQLSKDELIQVIQDTKEKLRLTNSSTQNSGETNENNQDDEYRFENYDNDDDENVASALGISSLAELQNDAEENFSESDDSDKEDEMIKSTDSLILVGHVEGDSSCLEVYVYNEEEESLYVHHDILLPSFPLCIEWLNYEPNSPKGNYCAIGTMAPIIQVWDLDVINCIEPAYSLGKTVKKNRQRTGHNDAVLALAWNQTYEHVLASGSVDQTILLWDLDNQKPTIKIEAFHEKVQCLEWHHLEAQTLLAGGADKLAKVFDCRTPEPHQTWQLDGEAERVSWNPSQPFTFFVGTNIGSLQYFDCRKGQIWSTQAHEKEVTGLVVSRQCPGLMITSSPDGAVKIWDITENDVVYVCEKNFNLGTVQCLDLSPDLPFVITAGGDDKSHNFTVFDLRNVETVRERFESRQLMELVPENSMDSN